MLSRRKMSSRLVYGNLDATITSIYGYFFLSILNINKNWRPDGGRAIHKAPYLVPYGYSDTTETCDVNVKPGVYFLTKVPFGAPLSALVGLPGEDFDPPDCCAAGSTPSYPRQIHVIHFN